MIDGHDWFREFLCTLKVIFVYWLHIKDESNIYQCVIQPTDMLTCLSFHTLSYGFTTAVAILDFKMKSFEAAY